MLRGKGYFPNRVEHSVATSKKAMRVMNLTVNAKSPSLSKKDVNNIRAAVKECENMAATNKSSNEYKKLYDSVRGKVYRLKQFNAHLGGKYLSRLDKINPAKK
jgi:hypothetical protein